MMWELKHDLRRIISYISMGNMPTRSSIAGLSQQYIDANGNGDFIRCIAISCCATCGNHTPELQPSGARWDSQYHNLSDFQKSADKGCRLCSVIFRGVTKAFPIALEKDWRLQLSIHNEMFTIRTLSPTFSDHIEFHALPGHPPHFSTMTTAELLPSSLRDEQCFSKIRSWLSICENTHDNPRCRQKAEVILPRRLIHITKNSDAPILRLQQFDGAAGRYIALSHCWGGFKGCQTTKQNIEARINGINYDDLPQTFKDAIYCALQLEVFYVWIDSLCIIQNDTEDWERESSKMCDIYSEAYLVLAAASADSDTKGFLANPDCLYRGIELESTAGSGHYDLVMHRRMPHPSFAKECQSEKSTMVSEPLSPITAGPLGMRAWTLQETLLSRRCVGFNENEIAWECRSSNACECDYTPKMNKVIKSRSRNRINQDTAVNGPIWIFNLAKILLGDDTFHYRVSLPRPLGRLDDTAATFTEWRQLILPNFTRRSLTIPSDKLPALSGIANIIAQSCNDEYIAGVWRKDIVFGLAWRVDRRRDQVPDLAPVKPLGPSFSWVSVEEKIAYNIPTLVHYNGHARYGSISITVIDYNISLSGQNRYGSVEGGWLRISALFHTMRLQWNASAGIYNILDISAHRPYETGFYPDTMLCDIKTKSSEDQTIPSVQRATSYHHTRESFHHQVTGVLLLDIPIANRYMNHHKDISRRFKPHEIALLILSKSPVVDGNFVRIGLAVYRFEPHIAQQWIQCATRGKICIE